MSWFYVRDHQIIGPVEPPEFQSLVNGGVVHPDTLVWRQGLAGWSPWGEVQTQIQTATGATDLGLRDVRVSVGQTWSQALEWFGKDPWKVMGLVTGAAALILVIGTASYGLSLIVPFVSSLVTAFVTGPLQTSLLLTLLTWIRGGRLDWANVWSCFGPRYWPLVAGQMVLQVIFTIVALIVLAGLGPMFVAAYLVWQDPDALPPMVTLAAVLVGGAVGMIGIILYFYLAVAWLFAPLLILDKELDFWPAMKLSRQLAYRHPWSFSWFLLVASTLAFAGILLVGIGLVLTLPLATLMLVLAYERQFGDLPSVALDPPLLSPPSNGLSG